MNTVAIIQARMASTRLPGKVLKAIGNKPMLAWVVDRVRRARCLQKVIVATTTDMLDDEIAAFCEQYAYPVTRGSLYDVLDRFYQAASQYKGDVVVRLTADCPLIDPQVIDHTVSEFISSGVEFAANRLPPPWKRTYPIGLDTEVCTFAALERAWKEATQPYQREHVMPYFYDTEGRFRTLLVHHHPNYGAQRWTVDTPQDLEFIRQVVSRFTGRDDFSWYDVLALLEREPQLLQINADIKAKLTTEFDARSQ